MTDHDPMDDAVRRALAREAESVQPDENGLGWIRSRIRDEAPRRSRKPWLFTIAGAVAGTAAVVGAVSVLGPDTASESATSGSAESGGAGTAVDGKVEDTVTPPKAGDPDSPVTTATPGPGTTAPSKPPDRSAPPPAVTRAVPVYWLGAQVGRPDAPSRLYRTFVKVTSDPAFGAVQVMTTQAPGDPDYRSAWRGADLSSAQRIGGYIRVDFNTLPDTRLSAAEAKVAVQSLVYTVQGALGVTDTVQITLRGKPVPRLFGQVDAREPFQRAPAADVQAMVWVTAPAEGATASSPVKVSGIAAAFEATVSWQVLDATTKAEVRKGFTTAAEGMKHSPFSFTVDLPAGRYVIHCYEASAEDGRTMFSDTKTITVR